MFALALNPCSIRRLKIKYEMMCIIFSGIAIDKDGIIYFADGANIRTIAENGTIRTLIGSQGHPKYFDPLPCYKVVSTDEVRTDFV
jgi:hypothetical protein